MPALTALPNSIVAGDTLEWTESANGYPASAGWTLKYGLLGPAGAQETVASAADGDSHAFTVPKATTATWEPGAYVWTSYAESATERFTVCTGTLNILPDPAVAPADTWARQTLEAIQDALAGRLASGRESFTINGQSISKIPAAQLEELLAAFEARVAREDEARKRLVTGGKKRRVLTVFSNR